MPTTAVVSLDGLGHHPVAQIGARPVSFVRIAGVPLLTRQLLTLLQSGVERVWLVAGKHALAAQNLIQSDARLREAPIELLDGAIREALPRALAQSVQSDEIDRVIISAGDVVFGPGLVRHAQNGLPAQGVRRMAAGLDLFAAPASAFRRKAAGALLPVLQEAITLSGEERPAAKDAFAKPVRAFQDIRAAKRAIFSILTKPTSGWVSRNLNSRLSLPLSKILSEFPVTPNMMTVLTTLVGIAACPLLAHGTPTSVFWGGLCFQLASALDRCDGELARSKFQASLRGEWIDTIGDNLTYLLFVVGVTLGMHQRTGQAYVLYIGFGLLALLALVLAIMYSYLLRNTQSGSLVAVYKDMEEKFEGREKPVIYRVLDRIRFMGKRDFFSLTVFVVCAFNALAVVFWGAVFAITAMLAYLISARSKLGKTGQVV